MRPILRRPTEIATGVLSALLIGLPALAELGRAAGAEAPQRPNILVIMADDMGFSDLGCYGGEINTPNLHRLAHNGLRFTRFHSTGRCWPSRAALLTGYYAQQVRMDPVRRKFDSLPDWAPMLSERLNRLGYRSYHSGKWHIHLERKVVQEGGFDRSYVLRDHNRFFYPKHHELDDERLPPVDPEDDYYATTAIADYAIDFLKEHEKKHEDKPWFTYLAFTAPHFPLHAPQEDVDRYRGKYEEGWDAIRRKRLKRMKKIGIVDQSVELPPLQPDVVPSWNMFSPDLKHVFGPKDERPKGRWHRKTLEAVYGPGEVGRAVPWESLSETEQRFQAEKMAVHAAMVDRMDREIGRVLEQIKAMGDRENTIVLFVSDNGASAELIVRGDGHDRSAPMGSGATYLCLGPGWSTASNTPFRLHKSWVHEGGIASPLIVNWPAGIASDAEGELRRTPGHFVDLLPTLLEVAGARQRDLVRAGGPPLPGRSLVPAFNEDRPIDRAYLFYRHDGHQALETGGWKLVSRDRLDAWQLYRISEDRNELNDLASARPKKVRELADRWKALNARFRRQATDQPDDGN